MDEPKLKWKTVKFEDMGANAFNADFEGLIGIEECSDYGLISSKKGRKNKLNGKIKPPKRKLSSEKTISINSTKKTKLDGDFMVHDIKSKVALTPSKVASESSEHGIDKIALKRQKARLRREKKKKMKIKADKRKRAALKKVIIDHKVKTDDGEKEEEEVVERDGSEMAAWSSFGIPDVILKNLSDQGFQKPTLIQELCLPAAMLGRRDILGAAETGSGKTLAFGLPILTGILEMKEKARQEGIEEAELFNQATKKKAEEYESDKKEVKLININKMTAEERKAVMDSVKSKKKKSKKKKSSGDDDFSDDDIFDSDDNFDSDDKSDVEDPSEDESSDEGIDDENDSNESDVPKSGSEESADEDIKENDCVESDFDELEEKVEGVNQDGIGCVKAIDNPSFMESDEVIVKRRKLRPLYCLILTPTRELAIQVRDHLVTAAKNTEIRVCGVVGGMAQVKQERLLSHGPEIVVATPGRLWELIQLGNDHLSQVANIRFLAIDETDRMVERGHFEELHLLLERINEDEHKRSRRQNFVFSATLTMVHELPKHLKGRKFTKKGKLIKRKVQKLTPEQKLKQVVDMLGICDPKVVDITTQNQGASNTLLECKIMCPIQEKDHYLYYILKRHPGRTIVFCNSIGCVKRLAQLLGFLQCRPLPLHASMQQRQRLKNLDKFRDDPHGILVATDVAARGLDIPNVEHVIHYQVPRTAENYVHRSGRTARASKEGIAILIIEPGEVNNYVRLSKTLAKTEDLPHFPVPAALLSAVKQRVLLAREVDLLELKVKKTNQHTAWLENAAESMDILIDDTTNPNKATKEEDEELKATLAFKKRKLSSLLATTIFPKGFSFKFPTSNNTLEDAFKMGDGQNAVQAMKEALETGLVRKLKKASKNQAVLDLESKTNELQTNVKNILPGKEIEKVEEEGDNALKRNRIVLVKKNKWKKMQKYKSK